MKISVLILLLAGLCRYTYSQTTHTITKDTIHLSGYVYYDNGKPVFGVPVTSTNKDLIFDYFPLQAYTDSIGYFSLKGAKHHDTLHVSVPFTTGRFTNRGARYMVITLPTPQPKPINFKPIEVTARREYKAAKPQFSIKDYQEPKIKMFLHFEQPVEYPGGLGRFNAYIQSELKYPAKAIKANIEGSVEAAFTIMKDGSLDNIKIVKGLGYGCDNLVADILKRCRKWRPALYFGRPVETPRTILIEFKLTDI